MQSERLETQEADTTYRRKSIIKTARAAHQSAAEASYAHVPMFETLICFQLVSGARRKKAMLLPAEGRQTQLTCHWTCCCNLTATDG